jgi:hypothetical protein
VPKPKLMWRHLAFIILLKKWLKGFGPSLLEIHGYFDQIMVSQSLIKMIFPISTGKQEFTTNLFNTNSGSIQRLS